METTQCPIVCVFSIDDAYCQHLAVTIASLVTNNPGCAFSAHIIHHDVERPNLDKLRGFLSGLGAVEAHFHPFDVSKYNFSVSGHITAATYFRLFLPEILPPNVGKAIYLDSDLIVLGSVQPLWETAMGDISIAAVVDPSANKPGFLAIFGQTAPTINDQLGLPQDYPYFNAGVLLVNLDAWRAKKVKDRLVDYVSENVDIMLYHDQDALNGVLHDDVMYLGYEWNFHAITSKSDAAFIGISEDRLRDVSRRPNILHFSGGNKPWKYRRKVPFEREYFRYLRMTPWRYYVQPDRNLRGFLGRYFSPARQLYRNLSRRAALQ